MFILSTPPHEQEDRNAHDGNHTDDDADDLAGTELKLAYWTVDDLA
jgi:hypothetical protein